MKRISISVFVLCACLVSAAWGQKPAVCINNWSEFHRTNMHRSNPCETALNVDNVGNLILKWSYAVGGAAMFSSPAVANGVVYVGSHDKSVYALNASTGALLWSSAYGGAIASSPAVANGLVYVGLFNGGLHALDASTGAKVWRRYPLRWALLARGGEWAGVYRFA